MVQVWPAWERRRARAGPATPAPAIRIVLLVDMLERGDWFVMLCGAMRAQGCDGDGRATQGDLAVSHSRSM